VCSWTTPAKTKEKQRELGLYKPGEVYTKSLSTCESTDRIKYQSLDTALNSICISFLKLSMLSNYYICIKIRRYTIVVYNVPYVWYLNIDVVEDSSLICSTLNDPSWCSRNLHVPCKIHVSNSRGPDAFCEHHVTSKLYVWNLSNPTYQYLSPKMCILKHNI
jgi:hypothetical protein